MTKMTKMVNRAFGEIDLDGSLVLEMGKNHVRIEFRGRDIKIFFASFKSLANFLTCYRVLKKKHSYLLQTNLNSLNFYYYLGHELIGETNSNSPLSLFGRYLGNTKGKFYIGRILKYFFNPEST